MNISLSKLGCGGSGDGFVIFGRCDSREILGATDIGGGGMEPAELPALLFLPETATDAGLSRAIDRAELERAAAGAGVTEFPLLSPIVMRMNSLSIPSSP